MRLFKLRIAFSALCSTIYMLLIALWVRSCSWVDAIPIAPSRYIGSMHGEFCFDCEYSYPPEVTSSRHRFGPIDVLCISNPEDKVSQWIHVVDIPMWPVILLIAGLAATPWIPWRVSWSVACVLVAIGFVANWIVMYNDSWGHKFRITNSTVLSIEGYRGRLAVGIWDSPRGGPEPTGVLWQLHRGPEADEPTGIPLAFRFLGRSLGSGVAAVIPYWFLILLCVAAAVAPWVRWRKRFSLRTLLIGMTLVGVVLGVIVYVRKLRQGG